MVNVRSDGYFPFSGRAESKRSQAGNDYMSISICQGIKKQDNSWESVYFNMIDKRDLLSLASCCESLFHKICEQEAKEREAKRNGGAAQPVANQTQPAAVVVDDDIPFN